MILSNNLLSHYLIISFYTAGFYEGIIKKHLLQSLQEHNLPYYIEGVESKMSWSDNTNMKPFFISAMLKKFPHKTLIWLDADSQVKQPPSIFGDIPDEYDMGIFYLDLDKWYKTARYNGRKELGTGIVMVRNRPIVQKIMSQWIGLVKYLPKVWEQKHLQKVVEECPGLRTFLFPLEYSYIYELPNGSKPFIAIQNPVVVQYQASRHVRKQGVVV